MRDAPLGTASFVRIEVPAIERGHRAILGAEMRNRVALATSVVRVVQFDSMVRDGVHGPRPPVMCVDNTIAELPGIPHEHAMVVGGVGPVRRLHDRHIETVDSVGISARCFAARFAGQQLLDARRRIGRDFAHLGDVTERSFGNSQPNAASHTKTASARSVRSGLTQTVLSRMSGQKFGSVFEVLKHVILDVVVSNAIERPFSGRCTGAEQIDFRDQRRDLKVALVFETDDL